MTQKGNRAFTQYFNAYVNEKTKEVWFRLYDFANQLFEQDYSPTAIARCPETCTIKCPPEPGVIVVGTAKDVIDLIKRSKRKDMKPIIEAALLGLSVEITRNTGIDVPGIRRETKGKIERKPRKIKQELIDCITINGEPVSEQFKNRLELVLNGLEENSGLVIEDKIEETQELPDTEVVDSIYPVQDNWVYKFEGQMVTNSSLVAIEFEKEHKNVLQTIQNLVAENSATKFYFIEKGFDNRGKKYPMFLMNRKGFSLLAMGFTGSKTLQFKIAFLEAFDKMEVFIREKLVPKFDVPQTYAQTLRLAAEQQEQIEIQAAKIEADKPFNDYAKVIMENGKDMTMREFAIFVQHELGIPEDETGRNKIFEIYENN